MVIWYGNFLDNDFAPPPYSFRPEICTSKFMHCFAWNASNNCSVANLVLILGKTPYKDQNERKKFLIFRIWTLFLSSGSSFSKPLCLTKNEDDQKQRCQETKTTKNEDNQKQRRPNTKTTKNKDDQKQR